MYCIKIICSFQSISMNSLNYNSVGQLLFALCFFVFLKLCFRFLLKIARQIKLTQNIPGPCNLPLIGATYKFTGSVTDCCNASNNIYEKYPGIAKVWFGPQLMILLSDAKYIDVILNNKNSQTKTSIYEIFRGIFGNGLVTAPVLKWKAHRKIISPCFNKKVVLNFIATFNENSALLTKTLEKQCQISDRIDIKRYLTNCFLDNVLETTLEHQLDAQRNNETFSSKFESTTKYFLLRIFKIVYRFDCVYRLTEFYKEEKEAVCLLDGFVFQAINNKLNGMDKDLLENFIEIEGDGSKSFIEILGEKYLNGMLQIDDIVDEAKTIVTTGTDTLVTSICFLLTALAMHPEIQEKVYREVIDVLGPDRPIEVNDLYKIKYVDCAIKESLRIFPSLPVFGRLVKEDISLGEIVIPKESQVFINLLYVHRNEKYWPNPLKYDPDRFLPEHSKNRHPCSWMPFSVGPRNCVGLNYAMIGLKITACEIIRKFKFQTTYKNIEEIELDYTMTLNAVNGYGLSFEVR